MKKQPSEMSDEELWELFPIILKEHNPQYKDWYEIEKQRILEKIKPDDIARINHIGSSAVEGSLSKPTIDILFEIDGCCDVTQLIADLEVIGWGLINRGNDPMSLSFVKGYTPDGFAEKVYHLHVKYLGNWNELYFRDYLIAHSNVTAEYGELKRCLREEYEHNRDGYTDAKSDFIVKYSNAAKQEFQNKYKPR